MYCYEMYPIDVWTGWILLADALEDPSKYDLRSRAELNQHVTDVQRLLRQHTTWEGDGTVYLTAVPHEPEAKLVFAIKQSNNGTTYVVSPVEYVHLKEFRVFAPAS